MKQSPASSNCFLNSIARHLLKSREAWISLIFTPRSPVATIGSLEKMSAHLLRFLMSRVTLKIESNSRAASGTEGCSLWSV